MSIDYFDGTKTGEKVEADQKLNGLKTLPTVFELLGFCYYYTAFFIGPQFTFNRYRKYLTGELFKNSKEPGKKLETPTLPTIKVLVGGIIYLIVNTIGTSIFPSSYLTTNDYLVESTIFHRLYVLFFTCYFLLSKYLGIWLLGEGSSRLSGIGFGGYDSNGLPIWNGLANVNPYLYETSTSIQGVVMSFNINTNDWSKRYIFKRLRFLGNKDLSLIVTTMVSNLYKFN